MSRIPVGDVQEVPPSSNVYTVLVGVALVVQLLAFGLLYQKYGELFKEGISLFQ